MIWFPEKWRRRRILKRAPIAESIWQAVIAQLPFLQGLTAGELERLRQWTTIFLHDKKIHGVQDLVMTEAMRVMIAVPEFMMTAGIFASVVGLATASASGVREKPG